MSLKVKVTAAQYAKLSPELQAEYTADGDDFALSLEGVEDTGALRRSKDTEVAARRAAEQQVRDLTAKLAEATEGTATAVAAEKALHTGAVDKLSNFARNALVDNVAQTLAASMSDSPSLLVPLIKSRLMADIDSDTPATRVLGADGKVSKLTLDELKAEFVANKEFSAIIRTSGASGAGPARNGQQQQQIHRNENKDVPLDKLPNKDFVAEIKARAAEREAQGN